MSDPQDVHVLNTSFPTRRSSDLWEIEGRGSRPEIRCVLKAFAPARPVQSRPSGRQFLAALRAAVGENLAAANRRLAGAETVATGAHEVARLKGTQIGRAHV